MTATSSSVTCSMAWAPRGPLDGRTHGEHRAEAGPADVNAWSTSASGAPRAWHLHWSPQMLAVRPLCCEVPSAALAADIWWRIDLILAEWPSGGPCPGLLRIASARRASGDSRGRPRAEQRRSRPRRCRSPADTARTTAICAKTDVNALPLTVPRPRRGAEPWHGRGRLDGHPDRGAGRACAVTPRRPASSGRVTTGSPTCETRGIGRWTTSDGNATTRGLRSSTQRRRSQPVRGHAGRRSGRLVGDAGVISGDPSASSRWRRWPQWRWPLSRTDLRLRRARRRL